MDADKQEILVLRRSGDQWMERRVRSPDLYHTELLPGFELDCRAVSEAAEDIP